MASKKQKDLPQTKDPSLALSPQYEELLENIKERIRSAQTRAAVAVNRELVLLYYGIGQQILEKQKQEGWGSAVIDRLAIDIRSAFPRLKGFSPRSLWYMRELASAYPESEFKHSPTSQIPWGHLMKILDVSKEPEERMFYVEQTLEHGWSQRVLDYHIGTKLYQRQGKALTNFSRTLPAPHANSAQQVLKDPYIFHFLEVGQEAEERDIERGLMGTVEKFLLELGTGFALVARQYHLQVGKKDKYIDLLFYHLNLRCFVVIDLKAREFDGSDSGQLNVYLSAIDDRLRKPGDNPTIGLILCQGKDSIEVEYALRDVNKPIGVSTYELKLLEKLPENLKRELPTIEEIEHKLVGLKEPKGSK